MKKAKPISCVPRLLVVCVLLFSFISSSLNLAAAGKNIVSLSLVKKVKGTSQSDAGFPIEDQETEIEGRGEDKCESNLTYIDALNDALIFLLSYPNLKVTGHYKPYGAYAAGVPIYIAKRTLLI